MAKIGYQFDYHFDYHSPQKQVKNDKNRHKQIGGLQVCKMAINKAKKAIKNHVMSIDKT